MKKNTLLIMTLIVMSTIFTACSGSDDVTEPTTPQQPAPPAASGKVMLKGTLNSATRSTITEAGVSSWSEGDVLAVRYQQKGGGYDKVDATISGNGEFSVELTNPVAGTVNLIYPASLYQASAPYYATATMLTNQKGTLADVGANWNIQTASPTMTISDNTASLGGTVEMQSQIALCQFTLKKDADNTLSATKLDISDGTNNYTIMTTDAKSTYYVAMLPTENATISFNATTTETGKIFTEVKKFSPTAITSSDLGNVIATDGKVYNVTSGEGAIFEKSYNSQTLVAGKLYASNITLSELTNGGLTLSAMIAYVGSSTGEENYGYNHGLAIAMKNAGKYQYATSNNLSSPTKTGTGEYSNVTADTYPAFYYASIYNVACPEGSSKWFLGSASQWGKMHVAFRDSSLSEEFEYSFSKRGGINISNLTWLSDYEGYHCAYTYSYVSSWGWGALHGTDYSFYTTNEYYVRPLFAF